MSQEDVISSLKGKVIQKNHFKNEYGEMNEWTPYNAELQMQSIKVLVKDPVPSKVAGGSFEDTMLLLEMIKEKQQKENKQLKEERIRKMAMEKKEKISENSGTIPDEDGNYNFEFTDDDGSVRRENGISGGSKDGEVSWISPEGETVQFSYVADENGYQASGSHDPVPVPLPNGDPNGPGGARNNLEIWADLMQIGR